ncbi:unnamed protein product, partial [Nesidiocoris tenuis]
MAKNLRLEKKTVWRAIGRSFPPLPPERLASRSTWTGSAALHLRGSASKNVYRQSVENEKRLTPSKIDHNSD